MVLKVKDVLIYMVLVWAVSSCATVFDDVSQMSVPENVSEAAITDFVDRINLLYKITDSALRADHDEVKEEVRLIRVVDDQMFRSTLYVFELTSMEPSIYSIISHFNDEVTNISPIVSSERFLNEEWLYLLSGIVDYGRTSVDLNCVSLFSYIIFIRDPGGFVRLVSRPSDIPDRNRQEVPEPVRKTLAPPTEIQPVPACRAFIFNQSTAELLETRLFLDPDAQHIRHEIDLVGRFGEPIITL